MGEAKFKQLALKNVTADPTLQMRAKGLDDAVVAGIDVRTRRLELPKTPTTPSTPLPSKTLVDSLRRRLRDEEIVGFVREHGPLLRDDVNCQQYAITKLVRAGELLVTYTTKGQSLRAK